MADFARYAAAGYGPALLPIIPHDAVVSAYGWLSPSEGEGRREQITKNRGKVPGKRLADGSWVGFGAFTKHEASDADLQIWAAWPDAGVGLQAARFPAFDIDVEDEAFVAALLRRVQGLTGFIYGRVGRRPRILLPFRAAEGVTLSKRRFPLPVYGDGAAVELLGAGQQYVIDGIHPKTGQPYAWGRRGFPEADQLPVLDAEMADRIFAAAAEIAGVNALPATATSGLTTEVQPVVLPPNFLALTEAVKAIPNDMVYDTWISLGHAIKACTNGSGEGLELWTEWSTQHPETTPEACLYKWESFQPPYRAGWNTVLGMLPAATTFNAGTFDFTEVEQPREPLEVLMGRYIWVERIKRAFDRETGALLDAEQFSIRNNHIGVPSTKTNAWAQWTADNVRLQRAVSATYRPGFEQIVQEKEGACVNTWSPPDFTPRVVDESEAQPWLDHMAYLVPDGEERTLLLDWFAAIVQQPAVKPNYQVVWGSRHHGVGKDLALEPVRLALGRQNVRNVHPEQILSQRTDWFESARLIVVEEMKSYGRRELENKLRPFLASPPDYVPISKVYMPTYDVPNIAALIFLTNEDSALPISKEDRRHFVVWAGDDVLPRDEKYYTDFVAWYKAGGCEAVASYLMQRDVSAFNMKGRAPMTEAKREMIAAARTPLEAWIEDGIADATGPFKCDIVDLGELFTQVPKAFKWDGGTPQRLAQYLQRVGVARLGRVRLGKELHTTSSDRGTMFALRRVEMYRNQDLGKIIEIFWKQRETAQQENMREEFTAC